MFFLCVFSFFCLFSEHVRYPEQKCYCLRDSFVPQIEVQNVATNNKKDRNMTTQRQMFTVFIRGVDSEKWD